MRRIREFNVACVELNVSRRLKLTRRW